MIAPARKVRRRKKSSPPWHPAFLAMLPVIRKRASYAFYRMQPEAKEDAIEEVVVAACVAFARLFAQGKAHVANPSALTRFAVRRYCSGRRLACKLNVDDILSPYCQLTKRVILERLDRQDPETGEWEQILVEDRHAGPAETAAARIDLREWFRRMGPRDRRIAQALAVGERTLDVARRFGISPGRVSQKRVEFRQSWDEFQPEGDGEEETLT